MAIKLTIDKSHLMMSLAQKKSTNTKKVRVLVLSYGNCANFGDRLGSSLLNMVFPPWVEVFHSPLPPFWKSPSTDFDLVIIGTGHSIFHRTLDDELLEFLERIPVCIGIFGTQYRNLIDKERLRRLFDNMDYWFARNADDIDFVGQAAKTTKTTHLGDWLINAFPMTQWHIDKELYIPPDFIKNKIDILTVVQKIQSYKAVFSSRLHPLLCALTSAERAKYKEQREMGSQLQSGKFNSMLVDIFGESLPEDTVFTVNRDEVFKYKSFVVDNTQAMKDIIWKICEEPTKL